MDTIDMLVAAKSFYLKASEELRRERKLLGTILGSRQRTFSAEAQVGRALERLHVAQSRVMVMFATADQTLDVMRYGDVVVCREDYIGQQRKSAAEYGAWREYSNSRKVGRMPKRFVQFGDH